MNLIVLTQVSGWLKWPAKLFGQVFEWLFELLSLIGIENVAVTVILFTIVTKLLMTPLTIKQQKFSRLSNKMNPELTAIQEKYKGKKDEKSMRMQQLETQAVYEKYGTSPTSGCLPMLITLPIMFALYRVIYAIPAYVDDIYALYNAIAEGIKSLDYFQYMSDAAATLGVATSKWGEIAEGVMTNDHIIDIMTKFGTEEWNALAVQFPSVEAIISENVTQINAIHSVGKFNILDTPWDYKFSLALLIPVLATVTQLISSKLSMAGQKKNSKNNDNPMAQSMNSMMYTMPFMSGFMCFMFPICIGIYWVASTVVTTVYQIFINRYIDKMDINEMIAKNVEKQNKKKEKFGIEYGSKMAELAKTQTKNIDAEAVYTKEKGTASSYANATGKNYTSESGDTPKASVESKSIAGYANMLKRD